MINRTLLVFVFIAFSVVLKGSPLDERIGITKLDDYFAFRANGFSALSKVDNERFLVAIDYIFRRCHVLLDTSAGEDTANLTFISIVAQKTPREIIVLGSLMALDQCSLVELENENLLKGAEQAKVQLYRLRASHARGMRNVYIELIGIYAPAKCVRSVDVPQPKK